MTRVTIQHASCQRDDPRDQQREDAAAIFAAGGDFIGLTEIGTTENRWMQTFLRTEAAQHGYRLFLPGGYGEGIAVRASLGRVTGHAVTRPFVTHRAGQYPDRAARWVTVEIPGLGRVCYVVWHTNPHDTDTHMHATNLTINRGVGALVRRKGQGQRVVFGSADTNVDDDGDALRASTRPLRDAGLVSCWDESGKHPSTLGDRTVDVIYRYRPDQRVTLVEAHALPKRNSDHTPVIATYNVRRLPQR